MMSTRISIAFLVLLRLQQTFKHKILNIFPVLNLVLSCLYRMHTIKAINRHPQVLTKCNISRQHAGRLRNSTVHNQLNHGQTFNPVPTLVCKCTNNLFYSTILVLGLTIGLRMVSATKYGSCTHDTPQCFPKCSSEASITIMQNHFWYSKELKPIFEKQLCNFRSSELPFPRPAGY